MLHYLDIGGRERPVCFSYSVAYEYELQTGKFYEQDVAELAAQVIMAGAQLKTDDVAAAARTISMVKFVDIFHATLVVGARKSNLPVDFTKYDVADWLGEAKDTAARFTTLLLEANFNLKPDQSGGDSESPPDSAAAKKKSQARSSGTNS